MKMPEQTTGRRLILKDNTTIEDGKAGYADGFLWLWFSGYTLQQAAAIFFDPSKTETIVFQYGGMQDEYTGFTDCRTLTTNADGEISVCMVKGE
jgi:hypothetical protein